MKLVTRSSILAASELALALAFARPAAAEPAKQACIDAATRGQLARDDGRWLNARASFLTCAASSCPGPVRAECTRWLTELDEQLPSLVLGAKTAEGRDLVDARVDLDGVPLASALDGRPRAVDPGTHHVRFTARDGRVVTLDVAVRAGETSRAVVATFPALPLVAAPVAPPPPRPAAPPLPPSAAPLLVFGGLTLAAAGLTAGMVAYAHGEDDLLASSCSPRCTDDQLAPLHRGLVVANVALVASVASLGAFAFFAWRRSSFTITPTASGASFALRY